MHEIPKKTVKRAPEKTDSQAARLRKGSHGGRPPGFDEERYKKRNTVEMSKPQCCHTCGSTSSPWFPSWFRIIVA
ncbi:hypothetical protein ACFXKC_55995, partial [Streptomyces sp. NPDC059340]